MAVEQAIEKTTANIKWVTENKAHVLKWFTEETAWETRQVSNDVYRCIRQKQETPSPFSFLTVAQWQQMWCNTPADRAKE